MHLGGTLLGWFCRDDRDRSMRNVLLVTLAREPKMHLGRLATAFGVTDRYLWVLRRKAETSGIGAVLLSRMGAKSVVSDQKRRQLRAWFAEGVTPTEACRRQGRRGKKLSRATISRERARWLAEATAEKTVEAVAAVVGKLPTAETAQSTMTSGDEWQLELPTAETAQSTTMGGDSLPSALATELVSPPPTGDAVSQRELDSVGSSATTVTTEGESEREIVREDSANESCAVDSNTACSDAEGRYDGDGRRATEIAADAATCEPVTRTSDATSSSSGADGDGTRDEAVEGGESSGYSKDESVAVLPQRSEPIKSGRHVQHLGTWLLMALAKRDGLHDAVTAIAGEGDSNRIAVDAAVASLAIGEGTIEGVRRLATPTAPLLLRVGHTPTASGVRRRLWRIGEAGGGELLARVSERYVAEHSTSNDEPAVFLVDNHLRPYTGQQTLRKGWRMQDHRVCAGATDYYVHDEDGRPMFRIDVPSHDSLTQWLTPIATRLRDGLGADERILLVYDRAGAFPTQIAALRDAGFELVTYERRPFPELPVTAFDRVVMVRGESYLAHESSLKNLGDGRGRVRRIALRTPENTQINLLAISTEPLERLVAILLGAPERDDASGRWRQENGLKHGVERWGINQLDGRKVIAYPPGTIIPNPRRRRLDRALRLVRAEEGRARCELATLASDAPTPRRERVEADLRDAIERRNQLLANRPSEPDRLAIEDSELADTLVHHRGELKNVVDTIRIVCANGESDLASILANSLSRPKEAKKVVANIFTAPGSVSVTDDEIRIRLAPAANLNEHAAMVDLFTIVNKWKLTMPGDRRSRPLCVTLQPL